MRRAPAAAGLVLLLALLAPPGAADPARDCAPARPFPSLAAWRLAPGASLSYSVPPRQFGSVASADPIDVTLYDAATCAALEACHAHAATGLTACGGQGAAVMEVVNRGPGDALVVLAIGQCGFGIAC